MKTDVNKSSTQLPRFSNLNLRIYLAFLLVLITFTIPLIIATFAQKIWSLDQVNHVRLQSLLVTCFVVLGIWQFRLHLDRGNPISIGLGNFKQAFLRFFLGFGLLVAPLLITLLIIVMAGWAQITFNWQNAQLEMILLGMLSVFLTDALPEELIFRGYIFSNLREKYTVWKSAILTTFLFVLFPVILLPIQGLLGSTITTGIVDSISVGYLSYVLFFGAFAIYLRVLTKSIWTGVGFHLMFVYINQLIGLESANFIQISEVTSQRPAQITFVALLVLTFIALLIYPKIKGLKL